MNDYRDSVFYTIRKADGGPDWKYVPALAIHRVYWTRDFGIRAAAQLCFDKENLYVRMTAEETDIRAENTAPLSPVYEDSCLEFFFKRPDSEHYFNFEINPNGRLCIQYGPSRADRTYLARNDDAAYFDILAGRTDGGWNVSYRIPLAFLRTFDPLFAFDGVLRANFYKCGDKTTHPHYLAWAPIQSETPDFHRPADFGTVKFE